MQNDANHKLMRFALVGGAGYIAPRHYKAICDLGHELAAVYDVNDSIGILDQYAPKAYFFTSFERFDRFLDKQRQAGRPITHLVVCTPNHLHDAHIRFGLRQGMEVICEKPHRPPSSSRKSEKRCLSHFTTSKTPLCLSLERPIGH